MMIFDWNKAAEIIRDKNPEVAEAGLAGDWECTGGEIFRNGEIVTDEYTYLGSTWATPQIEIDGERIDCFKMEKEIPEWGTSTKWPESAKTILAIAPA